ncbi:MAG TPA: TonB C-terminal domain-containing protein, partial [Longimicrobiales bacterium]
LENIILQLNRYFRWSGAPNLEAKIGFEIMRDGSVRRIRVLQKSGNINFDLEAVSAIEQAGQRGAFGPLPKGWVNDRLPVAFSFLPPGR